MFKRIIAGCVCTAAMIACVGCSAESSTQTSGLGGVTNDPTVQMEGNVGDVAINDGDTYAVISIKDYGDITVKLFPEAAPKGVDNFISLANSGFYEGKIFHRIIADFMAQGGQADAEDEVEQFGIETNYNMRHFYGALCYANALGKNSTQFYIVNDKDSKDLAENSTEKIDNAITTYTNMAKSYEKGSNEEVYYSFQAEYYKKVKDFLTNASDAVISKYKEVGGEPSLDGNYTVFGQTVDGFDVLDKISAVEVEKNPQMNGEVSKPKTDVIIEKVTVYDNR